METDARAILIALAKPFAPDEIDWRVGSTTKTKEKGQALAYIDARAVMDRFDAVMGVNWRCEYPTIQRTSAGVGGGDDEQGERRGKARSKSLIVCRISLKIDGEWIWREDGAGDSAVEAEKGALSDALKRAAVRWGVGRFLYSLPSPWVKLDQWKAIERDEWPRLRQIAEKALADYQRDPRHRPAPPEAPPHQAPFVAPPAAQPPAQPAPVAASPARPAPSRVEQLCAELRQTQDLARRTQLLASARQDVPASAHVFESVYVDLLCDDLPHVDRDRVEVIASFATRAGLNRDGQAAGKLRGALAIARSRAA